MAITMAGPLFLIFASSAGMTFSQKNMGGHHSYQRRMGFGSAYSILRDRVFVTSFGMPRALPLALGGDFELPPVALEDKQNPPSHET